MLKNIPFKHTLSSRALRFLDDPETTSITGYCDGNISTNVIHYNTVFFRACLNDCDNVIKEHCTLSKLQEYDFVPKIISFKEIDNFHVLFTEKIEGVALDTIPPSDYRFKLGIQRALYHMIKLYTEKRFVHRDLHVGNIMIDNNNNVYLIDFETGYFPSSTLPVKLWTSELFDLCGSIIDYYYYGYEINIEVLQIFYETLANIKDITVLTDPIMYQEYSDKFIKLL